MLFDRDDKNSGDMHSLEAHMIRQLCSQLNGNKASLEEVKLLKEQNDMIREVRNGLRCGMFSRVTTTEPCQ